MVKRSPRTRRAPPAVTPTPSQNSIRKWREFRGIATQGELAIKASITRATISRLETGNLEYRQWLLERLATALDCQPFDLIGTDPYAMASILKIYSSIPKDRQTSALKALEGFARPKSKTKRIT
jgi:DNA-binding Xre family transcriptional regulator